MRWEIGHQRLAEQPVFARCSRADIRTLARAGDECAVPAGTVLCREGRIGYWLFVVTSGSVQLRVGDGTVPAATLRAGSHFGDVAIIGFGPQQVAAVVLEDATVFVLGRRHVLDLVHSMPGLRAGLFPGVDDEAFPAVVRAMRTSGTAAWLALPRRSADDVVAGDRVEQLPPTLVPIPSKSRAPVGSSPFADALALRWAGAGSRRPAPSTASIPLDRRVVVGLALVLAATSAAFAFLFHPDVLVVRPSAPIDVSRDVTVPGLPPPNGRYVVTAVDIEETNLVGLALATLRGEETVRRATGPADETGHAADRATYRRSQRLAAALVARRAGLDPDSVRFRDRGLVGPSAGLVYALVLADLTDVVDVPDGHVVAATGQLTDDGRVQPVGYVALKHRVARRSGATIFLVPSSGGTGENGATPVATLDEALAAVGSPRPR